MIFKNLSLIGLTFHKENRTTKDYYLNKKNAMRLKTIVNLSYV